MKPQGSGTFRRNDVQLLALALLTKHTQIPASQRLGIRDEVVAIGFDLAVSLRLLTFETEQAKAQARMIAYEVSKIFGTGEEDVLDADLIGDNRFGEAQADRW